MKPEMTTAAQGPDRATRLWRWLNEPWQPRGDGIDYYGLGRIGNRMATWGNLDTGQEDTPAGRAWDRGGELLPSQRPLKRWQSLLSVTLSFLLAGGILVLIAFLATR